MNAIRIVLHQNNANYKKEEIVENKMTYPLPPISTVIGAIHVCCGFKEYHPMDISIQGRYESMHQEPYTDYSFLNSTQDDRGILVKMKNEALLSHAFDKVAVAKKKQGNSFREGVTIQILNDNLLKEYRELKDLNDKIKEFKNTRIKSVMEIIKKRKKTLAEKKKKCDKKSEEYTKIINREKEIKNTEKIIDDRLKEFEYQNYTKPISKFRTLTTSLKYYEILDDIKLIIHIKSDRETMNTILDSIYDLKSIGRSEDFVELIDVRLVELYDEIESGEVVSRYSSYLDYECVRNGHIFTKAKGSKSINGTKYYLNKDYSIIENKRIFNKKKVLYASQYYIEETNDNIYIDKADNEDYIVNFL